jgi:hypothetical protein
MPTVVTGKPSTGGSKKSKDTGLKSVEVNPIAVIIGAVVVVAVVIVVFFVLPSRQAAKTEQNWTTPEAAAARAPGSAAKGHTPEQEAKFRELLQKIPQQQQPQVQQQQPQFGQDAAGARQPYRSRRRD